MMLIIAAALVASTTSSLQADLEAVAKLSGEPRIVSAAGLASDETPILTIENPSAFDPSIGKRRLVLVGADDPPAADAVVAAVRWFKTAAPPRIRAQWALSAMPLTRFVEADKQSLPRWLTFQAPDLIVEVGSGGAVHFDGVRIETVPTAATIAALQKLLTDVAGNRSPLHETIAARVRRSPIDIARVLAKRYPGAPGISYIPSVAWVNTLRLAAITRDESLRAKVIDQTKPWLSDGREMFGERIQLTAVAGTIVFSELAAGGDDLRLMAAGQAVARSGSQPREGWRLPPGTEVAGDADPAAIALARQGRELAAAEKSPGVALHGGGWTDDMFMTATVLARTGRWPGGEQDFDTAARLLIAYAGRLQRADGLFNHAIDGPAAWGRGNGFAAMGLTEALTAMPPNHPKRPEVLAIYRRQMAALKGHQAPDGMWREVIDEPGSYREETATAMLLTAMARGVRLGWLDRSYASAIPRASRALAAHVVDDGTIIDVCASTGGGTTKRYYLDRPALTGADDRGGAMALMAAVEMYEYSKR